MAKDKLSNDFVTELLKACLLDKNVLEICKEHLKFTYLSFEPHKLIFQEVVAYYDLHEKLPEIGILSERLKKKEGVAPILAEIKKSNKPDTEGLLLEFESFIKMNVFVEGYDKLADLYNDGKTDLAYDTLTKLGEKINSFSVTQGKMFAKVFEDFEDRHRTRIQKTEAELSEGLAPLRLGIPPLDYFHKGRLAHGDTVLFLAQSGVGKSLALRWVGMANARRGRRVVHFQAEDTKELCLEQYDALWSGIKMDDIRTGNIDSETIDRLRSGLKTLRHTKGEIIVEAYEKFGGASMLDCRHKLLEIEKQYGKIDVIIWDYLEKFEPGDGKKYSTNNEGERNRRRAVGDKIKNLCMEFMALGVTATQASSVKREFLNNPDWYMTRENVADFKAIVDPFSYFYTFNQTEDEYKEEYMRIYIDKMRKATKGQLVPIYMSRDNGRFIDKPKLYQHCWNKDTNKVDLR